MNNNKYLNEVMDGKNNTTPENRLRLCIHDRTAKIIGYLSCFDVGMIDDKEAIAALTRWRQHYMRYFLTQFEATELRTRKWIQNVVLPSRDRILFTIELPAGEIIGNFGICNMTGCKGELDNLIRGKKGGDKDLIFFSEICLLSWMYSKLNYKSANLHVFSNNSRTIKLHNSVGFEVTKELELYCNKAKDEIRYGTTPGEGERVDFNYIEMGLDKTRFFEINPWVIDIYFSGNADPCAFHH